MIHINFSDNFPKPLRITSERISYGKNNDKKNYVKL